MGRNKNYDRADLIASATALFRTHGYLGASTQMLVDALGVNRNSMYREFGSKEALFDACVHHYEATNQEANFGPLERPDSSLEEILALFLSLEKAVDTAAYGRGCLLCNSAVEFGALEPGGSDFSERYFSRILAAFRCSLTNAGLKGELDAVDVEERAHLLTASTIGLFVMLRAQVAPSIIRAAARAAGALAVQGSCTERVHDNRGTWS